jgi:hypothetical protein
MQYVGAHQASAVDPSCAEEVMCGLRVHPQLTLSLREADDGSAVTTVTLEQGQLLTHQGDLARYRVMLGEAEYFIRMDCDDYPDGWVTWAAIHNRLASQCHCEDEADCTLADACDTYAHRCVMDLCSAIDCGGGFVCDPFQGECHAAPDLPCTTADTCDQDEVCNPRTGLCVENWCLNDDCAPCSPLIDDCYECLSDCDCGPGVCREGIRSCRPGCAWDKLGLTRDNPESFELVYACVRNIMSPETAASLVGRFDETMGCVLDWPAGTCVTDQEMTCFARLRFRPDSDEITGEHWRQICALSRLPIVERIAGGYWLP